MPEDFFEKKENILFAQEGDTVFAEVIIPLALPQNYTWRIPDHLQSSVQFGSRVEVQLRNKKYAGIIKTLHHNKPEVFEPKEILNVLDAEPVVFSQQLQLWQWIADYYMCSEGEVMNAAVPTNLKLSSESILWWNEEHGTDFSDLNDEEYIVAEALELKKELHLSEVQQLLDSSHVYPVVKKLIDKKVCYVWEELKEKYKPKAETFITLNPTYHDEEKLSKLLNEWSRAPKQLALLLSYLHFIKTEGAVTQTQLLKKANASSAQLTGLIEKKILIAEKKSADRIPGLPRNISIDFTLSAAQKEALNNVLDTFKQKHVCLLHGVTA